MYYSEFILDLIEEVKQYEIVYNTKYDKRPKSEKENAWIKISEKLHADPEKCKKNWKNIRDRFVKVLHLRDRHFHLGGTELNAPQYIYFDKMAFMIEFSIRKNPPKDASFPETSAIIDISPEPLMIHEDIKGGNHVVAVDYTERFLEILRGWPIFYDENAEMRKYRSRESWRQVANELRGVFTIGSLRQYWTTLMKKYKFYLENRHNLMEKIENENIFEKMDFAKRAFQNIQQSCVDDYHMENEDSSSDIIEEDANEEHLECDNEVYTLDCFEDPNETSFEVEDVQEELDEETTQAVESIEDFSKPTKKFKAEDPLNYETSPDAHDEIEIVKCERLVEEPCVVTFPINSKPAQAEVSVPSIQPAKSSTAEDEYDLFGKKVALQLRDLAQKSRSAARKGEIKVLQLLMELEESLENQ